MIYTGKTIPLIQLNFPLPGKNRDQTGKFGRTDRNIPVGDRVSIRSIVFGYRNQVLMQLYVRPSVFTATETSFLAQIFVWFLLQLRERKLFSVDSHRHKKTILKRSDNAAGICREKCRRLGNNADGPKSHLIENACAER